MFLFEVNTCGRGRTANRPVILLQRRLITPLACGNKSVHEKFHRDVYVFKFKIFMLRDRSELTGCSGRGRWGKSRPAVMLQLADSTVSHATILILEERRRHFVSTMLLRQYHDLFVNVHRMRV